MTFSHQQGDESTEQRSGYKYACSNIIVMKRGMGKGYAAIENYLFYADNTRMFFGSAKDSLQKLVQEVKNL